MTIVIFDLNRTLYDPETDTLTPGTYETLESLKKSGSKMHLLSRREPGRSDMLDRFNIRHFFITIVFVEDKSADIFTEIINWTNDREADVYVVGDYRHEDIRFGNQAGAKTIWFRQGKFAGLKAEMPDDIPWQTISTLSELLSLICDNKK